MFVKLFFRLQNASTGTMGVFKTVMIGNQGVGKSSLFLRFKNDTFVEKIDYTVGLDNTQKSITFTDTEGAEQTVTVR